MSSILTNNSAMVALQTLKSINSQLGKTQSDIATGKTVANAKDNAAVWAISKVMETDQSAAKTIHEGVDAGKSRILIGPDAVAMDLLVRALPGRYFGVMEALDTLRSPKGKRLKDRRLSAQQRVR